MAEFDLPPAPSYCGPACACTCADDCLFCEVCQQSEQDSRDAERRYWERYAQENGEPVYIPQW